MRTDVSGKYVVIKNVMKRQYSNTSSNIPSKQRDVAALLVSDLHFSHKPPISRSADPWYPVMLRQIEELSSLQSKYDCPILCAGDTVDRWNSPPELVNFLLKHLPPIYAIFGNHDLPNHQRKDLHRSAFWTLVEAGKITLLKRKGLALGSLLIFGFSYGVPVKPYDGPDTLALKVAVVHCYIWSKGKGHPGASKEQHISNHLKNLKGYDVALYGDNHTTVFSPSDTRCSIFNPGGFYRRRSDEVDHRPCVGLLHSNGIITPHYLDVSKDKFVETEEKKDKGRNKQIAQFIDELKGLSDTQIDFRETLIRFLEREKADYRVREIILKTLEKHS